MSDCDNDGSDLLTQALPVGNLDNFDPTQPPSSAEDYLKKVVWEAKQYNDVKTVSLNESVKKKPAPIIQISQKLASPKEYIPSTEIQKEFLSQFSQLTGKIERCRISKNIPRVPSKLPLEDNEEEWCKFCFGVNFHKKIYSKLPNSSLEEADTIEGQAPLLSILLNISNNALENLIEWQCNWLEKAGFSEPQGRWFYSLLTCLEKPLTPETCSVLRRILKLCATIRASLDSKDDPNLIQLNMLITIISRYFNQDDLADS